jgi:hypothetical protein
MRGEFVAHLSAFREPDGRMPTHLTPGPVTGGPERLFHAPRLPGHGNLPRLSNAAVYRNNQQYNQCSSHIQFILNLPAAMLNT